MTGPNVRTGAATVVLTSRVHGHRARAVLLRAAHRDLNTDTPLRGYDKRRLNDQLLQRAAAHLVARPHHQLRQTSAGDEHDVAHGVVR